MSKNNITNQDNFELVEDNCWFIDKYGNKIVILDIDFETVTWAEFPGDGRESQPIRKSQIKYEVKTSGKKAPYFIDEVNRMGRTYFLEDFSYLNTSTQDIFIKISQL